MAGEGAARRCGAVARHRGRVAHRDATRPREGALVRTQLLGLGLAAVLTVGSASGGTTRSVAVASSAGQTVATDTTTTTRRDYTGLWGLLGLRPRRAVVLPERPPETRTTVPREEPPTARR
jgi:hypothetical protein